MRAIACLLLIFFATNCSAQEDVFISRSDSLKLVNSVTGIVAAFEEQNVKYLKSNSINVIKCWVCEHEGEYIRGMYDVTPEKFLKQIPNVIVGYWKEALEKKRLRVFAGYIEKRVCYTVLIHSRTSPQEHMDLAHEFIFIKEGHGFKLYGLSSIP